MSSIFLVFHKLLYYVPFFYINFLEVVVMKLLAVGFLVLAFSSFGFTDAQTTVFVSTVTASGGAVEGEAVHDLLEASIGEMNEYRISTDQKVAKITVKAKVVKLGNALMVTVEKVEGGQVKFTSQLKAAQPDWIFGFGPTELYNLNNGSTAEFGGIIGYTWELAEPSIMLKLFLDGTGGFSTVGIGADYFFSQASTSLYGGIDMGYGGAQVQGNTTSLSTTSVSGFSGGADFGFAFFRTSRVNVELALRVATIFSTLPNGLPGQYGLRLNILF
jgi:hypothetical protein